MRTEKFSVQPNMQIDQEHTTGVISISGEIDRDGVAPLQQALLNYLSTQPALKLDLSGIDMCHTAAFQVFLACRRSAEVMGKPCRITVSPFLCQTAEALGLPPDILNAATVAPAPEGAVPGHGA